MEVGNPPALRASESLKPVFDTLPKKVLAQQRVTSTQRGRGTMRRNLM